MNYEIQIFVPSTIKGDIPITQSQHNAIANSVTSIISDMLGGATCYDARGAWHSENLGLVSENIIVVSSFCTMATLQANASKITKLVQALKFSMQQEAITVRLMRGHTSFV